MLRQLALAAGISLIAAAPAPAVSAMAAPDPSAIIRNFGNELRVLVRTVPPEERPAQFHALLREAFAIPRIARFVLGRYWRVATPPQRQEFVALFEDYLVRTYSDRLSQWESGSEVLRVTGSRRDPWGAFVASEVVGSDAVLPLRIDWRLDLRDGAYKITDVIVDSVSMAATLRSDFADEIQRDWGRVQGLIAMLSRNAASAALGPSALSLSADPPAGR